MKGLNTQDEGNTYIKINGDNKVIYYVQQYKLWVINEVIHESSVEIYAGKSLGPDRCPDELADFHRMDTSWKKMPADMEIKCIQETIISEEKISWTEWSECSCDTKTKVN